MREIVLKYIFCSIITTLVLSTSFGQVSKNGEIICEVETDSSGYNVIETRTKPFDLDKDEKFYCTVSASMYRNKRDSMILGFTILIAVLNKQELFTISHEEYLKIIFEDKSELYLKPLPKEGKAMNLDAIYYSDQYFYFENKDIKKILNVPIKKLFLINESRTNSIELHPAEHGLGRGIARAFACLISSGKLD